MQDYITMTQYAELTGVSLRAVDKWKASGSLPPECIVMREGREMIDLRMAVKTGAFERHNKLDGFKNRPLIGLEDPQESESVSDEERTNIANAQTEEYERYISKAKYAEMIGVTKGLISKWTISGELPAECLVERDGRQTIDLEKIHQLGIWDRHTNRKRKKETCRRSRLKCRVESQAAQIQPESVEKSQNSEVEKSKVENLRVEKNIQLSEIYATNKGDMDEENEVIAKVFSIKSKLVANDSNKTPTKLRSKSEEEMDYFEEERRARLQKMKADAAIADMNQKRAEGRLLDADKFEDLVVDLFSNFNTYFAQFSEQSAASLYGLNDLQSMKSILDQRLNAMRERIREEIERKKMEAQRLIALQTKPLKF